jgi:hypothetical protein
MGDLKCVIWGVPAEYTRTTFDGFEIDSPRAGGRYRITGTAATTLQNRFGTNDAAKIKLSRLIYDSRSLPEPILLTTELIEKIVARPPVRPMEKADRLLRFIAERSPALNVAGLRWGKEIDNSGRAMALAAAELKTSGELEAVLEYLERKGFCSTKIDTAQGAGFVWLTLEGAEHVADLSTSREESDRAFVAMWFSNETQSAFEFGIQPAIRDLGYQPVRIDQKEHNNKIDDEIIAEIRRARFVVADFTCGFASDGSKSVAIARGGVYFEAGFAIGLDIPVIWCCREDLIGHVHFDTRQYNHVTWKDPDDLRKKLQNRIGASFGHFSRN